MWFRIRDKWHCLVNGKSVLDVKPNSGFITMKTAALIVAGGRGSRLGGAVPKQYLSLRGISVLRRTIERFLDVDGIGIVQVVIHPDDHELYISATEGLDDLRLQPPVLGGATRAETTVNGLIALKKFGPNSVLIHDAARPFVSLELIEQVIAALKDADGAFAGVPVVDALWHVNGDDAQGSVPRDGIWRAQTPQGFRFDAILAAHQAQTEDFADDVAVARAAGLRVKAVLGSEDNFKITVAADLERAEALLKR